MNGTTVIGPTTKFLVMPTLCIPGAPGQPVFGMGYNLPHANIKLNHPIALSRRITYAFGHMLNAIIGRRIIFSDVVK